MPDNQTFNPDENLEPTSGAQVPAQQEAALDACLAKVSKRLIPFMLLLYVVAYLDRINISFAGAPMSRELGFSDEVFGFGAGIFFIGYCIFGVPSNIMVERLGARRWIALIMVIWGIISVSMVSVKEAHVFYWLRFLLGVAEAGFFPGMILYLTYWFPRKEHARAVARFMSAIPLAGFAGGIISSKILLLSAMGIPGWKWLFIITGSPAVLLGLIVFFLLPERPQSCKWLNDSEKDLLLKAVCPPVSELQTEKVQAAVPEASNPFTFVFSLKLWHSALVYFLLALGMYGFQLWLPQIIKSFGKLDDAFAALLSAIPAVFQAVGMIVVANHSDKTGERRFHLAGSATLAAVSLLLCGFCPNPVLALICLSIAAFGIWGTVGPFWAMPTAYLAPAQAAAGIGLINSVGNLGGFAGPYLVGLIKEKSRNLEFALAALALSLFLAACLSLIQNKSGSAAK